MAPCEGLIPDHIRSTVDTTDAEAWAIDGFGGAHALAARSSIGRNHDGHLILLASSVSREHAELLRGETGWMVRDLGSRNGTFVDGVRIQAPVALAARSRLQIGDVALWFLSEVVTQPPRRFAMATSDGLVRYQLHHRGIELCIVVTGDLTAAGALLWRPEGTEDWSERALAPLEFQLLRALCVRAQEEAASPSPIRGCIPTKQLARELPFQSKYANEENVRQVVLRLRAVLSEIGASGMLAVAPGRGYYLACDVMAGALGR